MTTPSSQIFSAELLLNGSDLLTKLVKPLERLLANGCAIIQDKALCDLLQGLAYPCDDGKHWVASEQLLTGIAELGSSSQLIAAVMACDSHFRQPWLNIMAARCKEAAELSDSLQLVERVHQLGEASDWVVAALPNASLNATNYSAIEREMLGTQAESISAVPVLTRVLAMANQLSQWRSQTLPLLAPTSPNGQRPDIDWVTGRLLPTPKTTLKLTPYLLAALLSKSAENLSAVESTTFNQKQFDQLPHDDAKTRSDVALDWVLTSPWAFLLAAISYEQDIWASEGLGGFILELPAGQNSVKPSLVQVLVLNREGDEVLCGSLAQFIRRILAELSMAIFPAAIGDNELEQQLGEVIELLIKRQVWQHRDGASGELDYYQINPQFADACYRMKGQRAFALYGKKLREAIRTQALRWRQEQQSLVNQASTTDVTTNYTSSRPVKFLKDVS
ncbi:hypothetical protein [Pseudoalteromonas sp. SG43-3]|uniref:hypothetical protein n=1 Tax=Pseudoalteromonas sp. SG43-3 TaxID=2760970 RepID=UPI001601144F|nr:hypothetical protein [Pseudoalteromonas sp. SG43-3]MBB1445281.1 hypothetical protein [Pseudoalteromonas sp. SG43-3]